LKKAGENFSCGVRRVPYNKFETRGADEASAGFFLAPNSTSVESEIAYSIL